MRYRLLATLAAKSIFQNWRHSLATMLAILGGFSAVSLFDGFLAAIHEYNEEHYVNKGMVGHVLIEKAGAAEHLFEDVWQYSLSPDEQKKISGILEADSRVFATMRYLVLTGLISNGQNNVIFVGAGYEEDQGRKIRGEKWDWNVVAGKPLFHSPQEGGLMLGMGLAQKLGCEFDPQISFQADGSYVAKEKPLRCPGAGLQLSVTTEHSQVNAMALPGIGVADFQIREFNDKVLSMPLRTAQILFDTDRISRVIVLLNKASSIPDFLKDFREKTERAGLKIEALKWIDHPVAAISKGGLEVMRVFRSLFLAVVALIAGLSVANSMMKSINERVREIGTLRSFGFRKMDIVLLFSFEGLFLGVLSCMGGILVSASLAFFLSHIGLSFKAGILSSAMPVNFSIALPTWLGTSLVLSLITFSASVLVSRRAAGMVIADALRHTA